MSEEAPPLGIGEILDGRYRIVRVIGAGAMGMIYGAQQLNLGRSVALKVLRPPLASDGELVARFEQEARAASAIGHPNIVSVFDLGRCPDGSPYMVMELLDGTTLADFLAVEGPLPIRQAVDVGQQLLSALAAAHNAGIVHRDIKPDNLFLVDAGDGVRQVKVLDFGISKVLANPSLAPLSVGTRHGAVMGTPEYMSPEQARGQTPLIDHRTDIYAAGVVMYEMLCGHAPFEGENYNAVLAAILERRFPPLWKERVGVPPALDEVVARALSLERERRFATASDMRQALLATVPAEPQESGEVPLDLLDPEPLEAPAEPPRPPPPPPAPIVRFAPATPPRLEVVGLADEIHPPARVRRSGELAPVPDRRGGRGWQAVLVAVVALGGAAVASWYLHRPASSVPVPPRVALRVLPEHAELRLDGVPTVERLVSLELGSSHKVGASARGYLAAEVDLVVGNDTEVSLQLAHTLPTLDTTGPPPLPAELAVGPARREPTWEEVDKAVQHVEMHRECLARARRSACETLRRLALAQVPARTPLDAASDTYLHALIELENGRSADVARAAAAYAAEMWAERARVDAEELALLSFYARDSDWLTRRLLVEARLALRGGGADHRAAAAEALQSLRRAGAPDLGVAGELVAGLERPKKALALYNQLVEIYNARTMRP